MNILYSFCRSWIIKSEFVNPLELVFTIFFFCYISRCDVARYGRRPTYRTFTARIRSRMAPRLYTAERGFIPKVTNTHFRFPDPGNENSSQPSHSISLITHCNSFTIWHSIYPSIMKVLFTKLIWNNSTVETTLVPKLRIKQTCVSLRVSSAVDTSSFHDLAITKVVNFFIIKPNRCTNFTNLFCYETLHVSDSSSVYHQEFIHCTLSNGIYHTVL